MSTRRFTSSSESFRCSATSFMLSSFSGIVSYPLSLRAPKVRSNLVLRLLRRPALSGPPRNDHVTYLIFPDATHSSTFVRSHLHASPSFVAGSFPELTHSETSDVSTSKYFA